MTRADGTPPWTRRHFALIAATLASTFYAGLSATGPFHTWRALRSLPLVEPPPAWSLFAFPEIWGPAALFSISLFGILFAHEMGHYLTAIRAGHHATPPFFIPFVPPLGTLGAVLMLEDRPMPSATLMRIAAFGPFAGLVVALPICVIGLGESYVIELDETFDGVRFGTCALFYALQWAVHGPLEAGQDVMLHPIALAGWAGCLVTGLNMMPFGHLDGGHVAYAMWERKFNRWVRPAFFVGFGALLALGPGLLVFGLFVYFAVGLPHPPLTTDGPVRGLERWIGRLALLVFILTFTPRPIYVTWSEFFLSLSGAN